MYEYVERIPLKMESGKKDSQAMRGGHRILNHCYIAQAYYSYIQCTVHQIVLVYKNNEFKF